MALLPARGNIGARFTATLTDPDGTATGVELGLGEIGERGDWVDKHLRSELK